MSRGKRDASARAPQGTPALTSVDATIAALVARVEFLEQALSAMRAGANAMAAVHGLPLPYPTEDRS